MRLDAITVALRARPNWESVDLGVALAREHAARIWPAWIAVTLPVALVASAIGLALDAVWVGGLLLWWLKPWFDRIPLHVMSHAVFGVVPSVRETIAAQWRMPWRAMLGWLTWRRLHPGRALLLPVDLLEGARGARRSERVRVLSRGPGGTSALLTVVCVHVESMLAISCVGVVLLFVPVEFLDESAKAMWRTLVEDPPRWAQVLLNLDWWLAMTLVEPFYVGAGFGLYLDRRTELEAWDIELSFRKLAQRLSQGFAVLLVLVAACAPLAAGAASAPSQPVAAAVAKAPPAPSLAALLERPVPPGGDEFADAVAETYLDPALDPKRSVYVWEPRGKRGNDTAARTPAWLSALAGTFALLAEYGLWLLVAIALLLLAWRRESWLSPVRRMLARAPAPVPTFDAIPGPEPTVDDPVARVRELMDAGQPRAALALLYRSTVVRLAERLGSPLPPGATERDCIVRARGLGDGIAVQNLTRLVAAWRAAAYGGRLPPRDELDALLADWPAAWPGTR
ncbi:MAG TPA: DUF4129 domain-containing protein [Candidatus Saccharimonadia bacterium]|nr:DUF4129 domain-containing protein [Candidatus Saccharimonadia bacterium]